MAAHAARLSELVGPTRASDDWLEIKALAEAVQSGRGLTVAKVVKYAAARPPVKKAGGRAGSSMTPEQLGRLGSYGVWATAWARMKVKRPALG